MECEGFERYYKVRPPCSLPFSAFLALVHAESGRCPRLGVRKVGKRRCYGAYDGEERCRKGARPKGRTRVRSRARETTRSGLPKSLEKAWFVHQSAEELTNSFTFPVVQSQGMLSEDEWSTFMTSLRTPLPTTFRFTGSVECVLTLL